VLILFFFKAKNSEKNFIVTIFEKKEKNFPLKKKNMKEKICLDFEILLFLHFFFVFTRTLSLIKKKKFKSKKIKKKLLCHYFSFVVSFFSFIFVTFIFQK
jgi:hypothetical protein